MNPGQTYEDLGLNLEAGSQHDRAFIGPAQTTIWSQPCPSGYSRFCGFSISEMR